MSFCRATNQKLLTIIFSFDVEKDYFVHKNEAQWSCLGFFLCLIISHTTADRGEITTLLLLLSAR